MKTQKRIKKITVYDPGSPPDIDSDIAIECRDDVINYLSDKYGAESVANIVTFGRMAAKASIKAISTIYSIDPRESNSVTRLIPDPQDGKDMSIDDLLNPEHPRYNEASQFREATQSQEWQEILQRARGIEGRMHSTSVHACGVIVAPEDLTNHIPIHIRKEDGARITQFTYPECESLGLIKVDLLGLDCVSIVQQTLRHIIHSGKEAPNMVELTSGDMDDKEVYKLFQEGRTVGVFQFGSKVVRDLLLSMKPTEFADLAATTAIARPGPMKMGSHNRYADRKNGREKMEPIHPAFKNSPLDEILGSTYQILCYQEQVAKIASDIAGMTLQEGDKLRKAMGKKKADVMEAMRERFFQGAISRGYPEEAVTELWKYIEEFSKYAFNYSHSVAYSMNAYRTAWLKVHYPTEFFAASLESRREKPDKFVELLIDAEKHGIKVQIPSVNTSMASISPDYSQTQDTTVITLGFSALSGVGIDVSKMIVDEREKNGLYTSIEDFIKRCSSFLDTRSFITLANSGAFDCFNSNRRAIALSIPSIVEQVKNIARSEKKTPQSESLFSLLNDDENVESELTVSVDYSHSAYSHVEKLVKEAEVTGLYLSGHPLEKMPAQEKRGRLADIETLSSQLKNVERFVTVSRIERKVSREGHITLEVTLDDGTGTVTTRLPKDITARYEKGLAQDYVHSLHERMMKTPVKKRALKGLPKPELFLHATSGNVLAYPSMKVGQVFYLKYSAFRFKDSSSVRFAVHSLTPVYTTHEGLLPVRVRFRKGDAEQKSLVVQTCKTLAKNNPGETAIVASSHSRNGVTVDDAFWRDESTIQALEGMFTLLQENVEQKDHSKGELFSSHSANSKQEGIPQDWIDDSRKLYNMNPSRNLTLTMSDMINSLDYRENVFKVAVNDTLALTLRNTFGVEGETWDFGYYTDEMGDSF